MIKILYNGDVVGQPGRRALHEKLEHVIDREKIDFTIVNIENAAGGFGVTEAIMEELSELPINAYTSGNHIWDKKDFVENYEHYPHVIRPANYPPGNPGPGKVIRQTASGVNVAVLQLMGNVFMPPIDNPFFCADPARLPELEALLWQTREAGDSWGARLTVRALGVPPGLGEPVFDRLDADIAYAMMGINAVKGVEIGDGFGTAAMSGEDNADEMRMGNDGKPLFLSNHAGGILGGISSGQPIVARFAVKPTSSILTPRKTVDRYGNDTEISTKGRHDPCVGIRAVPIGEAMVACVLADHYLMHRGQMGEGTAWPFKPGA